MEVPYPALETWGSKFRKLSFYLNEKEKQMTVAMTQLRCVMSKEMMSGLKVTGLHTDGATSFFFFYYFLLDNFFIYISNIISFPG
jgi:hypothetical protein